MEVILLKSFKKLGNVGEIITVKPGFFRNYLKPNGIGLAATKANKEIFEQKKAELEAANSQVKANAEKSAVSMENTEIVIERSAGESGYLYGSVKTLDIAKELSAMGNSIDKAQVVLQEAIKTLGVFSVVIELHPEVSVNILVNVARGKDEAKIQMDKYLKALANPEVKETTEETLTKREAEEKAVKEQEVELMEKIAEEESKEEKTAEENV